MVGFGAVLFAGVQLKPFLNVGYLPSGCHRIKFSICQLSHLGTGYQSISTMITS